MHSFPLRGLIRERSVHYRLVVFALLAAVQVTLILAITVLAIGLPAIQRDLGLRPGQLALVSAGYGLTFAGLLLPGGRLADLLGARRTFLVGLAIFGGASIGVAVAGGFVVALAARLGQGVGAALVAPAAMALLQAVYPDPAEHRRAAARWGTLAPIGATAGIVVSGLTAALDAWRFGLLIPAGVATIALAAGTWLPPNGGGSPPGGLRAAAMRIDVPGTMLAALGITALSYGLVTAGDHGWSSPVARASLVIAVAGLAGFVVVEVRSREPLVPLPFLRADGRGFALGAVLLAAGAHASTGFFLALYLQQVRGLSALTTTAAFLPLLLVLPLAGAAATRLLRRLRPQRLIAAGLAIAAAGLAAISQISVGPSSVGLLPLGLVLLPAGVALTFAAATVVAVPADRARAGLAGALLNTAIELGPAIGVAILVALAGTRTKQLIVDGLSPLAAATGGYRVAFAAAAAALAVAAVLVARPIRRRVPRQSRSGTDPDTPITGG